MRRDTTMSSLLEKGFGHGAVNSHIARSLLLKGTEFQKFCYRFLTAFLIRTFISRAGVEIFEKGKDEESCLAAVSIRSFSRNRKNKIY